jgi:hypothetical protein
VDAVYESLGSKPFHIRAGLNAAIFDSVFVAFAKSLKRVSPHVKGNYKKKLLQDKKYMEAISAGTTDKETVEYRLKHARAVLFG